MNDFRNHIKDWYNFLWNCTQVNAKWSHWQLVNLYSGYGLLLLSGSELLPGPMLTKFYVTIWSQIARFIGPTWGPSGSCWPQVGRKLAPWTLLSEVSRGHNYFRGYKDIIILNNKGRVLHIFELFIPFKAIYYWWIWGFFFLISNILFSYSLYFYRNLAFHEDNVK